ncbi:MAG: hypothetical protein HOP21_06440 [Methylotenera sp.]|nr:hypothetical protein [Methylotenera sp.]
MLEGLEIAEIRIGDLERTLRVDAEFYKKTNLIVLSTITAHSTSKITELATVSDGNHMGISENFDADNAIPYYRGQDIHNFYIEQTASAMRIPEAMFETPQMRRSHLKNGDVLMSIVGTVGGISLVKTDDKATCSCKIAIIRSKKVIPEFLACYLQGFYGQNQIDKFRRGAVQTGLILEDFDQLLVPNLTENFQLKIKVLVDDAFKLIEQSKASYAKAEQTLLEAVGLADFKPSTQNTNIKTFAQSFGTSGRLDAEYYQPKYDAYIQKIKSYQHGCKSIAEVLTIPIKNGTTPSSVESGYQANEHYFVRVEAFQENLTIDETLFNSVDSQDYLKYKANITFKNDILVSMTGTIGAVAIYSPEKPALINQNIMRLRCDTSLINVESLSIYLKTIGKVLLERVQTGNVQPYVNTSNFETLIVPIFDAETQTNISQLVQQSFTLKAQSEHLLNIAKHAVEMAIEQDEAAAMAWIATQTKEEK